jgi:hypothetical protein
MPFLQSIQGIPAFSKFFKPAPTKMSEPKLSPKLSKDLSDKSSNTATNNEGRDSSSTTATNNSISMPHGPPHHERHSSHSEAVRDAIIGFADGLTVPFALTAGLSA